RAFIAILGNNSGGIESVALRCDQGSSIVCRRATNNGYSICSPLQGTGLIVLAPGCPQIGALSVHLDGTNVTGSMWLRTMSTSTSTFACVLIDNYTQTSVTPAPRATSFIVKDVQGLMVLSTVLCVRLLLTVGHITVIDAYDIAHGMMIMAVNSTITADVAGNYMFVFSNVAALTIVLINVSSTGKLLNIVFPTTAKEASSVMWRVSISIANSTIQSTGRFLFFSVPNPFNGTLISRNVLSMTAENSTFTLDGAGAELLQLYSFSPSSSFPPLTITVSILLSRCTINATFNSARLIYTSPVSIPPTLHNSSIVFEDSVVYQTWKTYVNYIFSTPPVPLIQADLNATTIVFAR
ncbi:transmembrane protein, putative, partial [Bodo saltans]